MTSKKYSGRKFVFFSVCLLAGFFTSFYVLIDSIAITIIPDPILFGLFTIIGGLFISLFMWVILSFIPISRSKQLGTILDNNFNRKNILLPQTAIKFVLLASLFNSCGLIIYLIGVLSFDPSLMLPLMQFVVIYLMIAEFVASRDLPTVVEFQSIVMITLGAVIVTINPEVDLDLISVLLVLLPLNFFNGISTFLQKKAFDVRFSDGRSIDAISIRVWTVFGLFLFYGFLSIVFAILQNRVGEIFTELLTVFPVGFFWGSLSMLITFFAQALRLKGLSIGKTYIVNALVSISVVFSIPLTLIAIIFIDPLIFGMEVSLDPFLWILKSIGCTLIFIGIVSMVLSEVRGYILVHIQAGAEITEIMQKIQEINGVQSVSALFGEYDLLIYFRIRSIGKVFKLIVREISRINGVENVSTQVVLSEINKY